LKINQNNFSGYIYIPFDGFFDEIGVGVKLSHILIENSHLTGTKLISKIIKKFNACEIVVPDDVKIHYHTYILNSNNPFIIIIKLGKVDGLRKAIEFKGTPHE